MTELIIAATGWTGSILLAMCGLPLLLGAMRDKSIAVNLPSLFLGCWFWGEALILVYAAMLGEQLLPIIFNTGFNLICILGILWIRWRNQ